MINAIRCGETAEIEIVIEIVDLALGPALLRWTERDEEEDKIAVTADPVAELIVIVVSDEVETEAVGMTIAVEVEADEGAVVPVRDPPVVARIVSLLNEIVGLQEKMRMRRVKRRSQLTTERFCQQQRLWPTKRAVLSAQCRARRAKATKKASSKENHALVRKYRMKILPRQRSWTERAVRPRIRRSPCAAACPRNPSAAPGATAEDLVAGDPHQPLQRHLPLHPLPRHPLRRHLRRVQDRLRGDPITANAAPAALPEGVIEPVVPDLLQRSQSDVVETNYTGQPNLITSQTNY